jgi:hypothetical protein
MTKYNENTSSFVSLPQWMFLTEPIPFNEATLDIQRMLTHPTLGILTSYALGGTFCVEHFFDPTASLNHGALMWYCLNQSAPYLSRFFLGFEQSTLAIAHGDPTEPIQKLRRPATPDFYTGAATDFRSVAKYLETYTNVPNCGDSIPFPNHPTQVQHIQEFDTFRTSHSGPTGPYQQKNWAFFQNNVDAEVGEGALTHLINQQNARYIRYYFGYDGQKSGANAIRIILFAVGPDGKNITNYIVQKSIPPA